MANNIVITESNKLWQFDIKYGYIHGESRAFYFLAFIDVFSKEIITSHKGTTCTGKDLKLTLEAAIQNLSKGENDITHYPQ